MKRRVWPKLLGSKAGLAASIAILFVGSAATAAEPAPVKAAPAKVTPAKASPAPATPAPKTPTSTGARPDTGGKPAVAAPPAAKGPRIDTPTAGSEADYDVKVRELEERVVGLKEKIFRTKTRLLLLREQVLNDVIAEAKAVIYHENDMGSDFKLEQVIYQLDGDKIYYQDNADGQLNKAEQIELFSGNVLPGNHVLSVEMRYRGDSSIFGYLKDYVFRLRANFTFYATKGKVTKVRSTGFLRGDITYDLTQRPYIKFKTEQESYTKSKTAAPKAKK